MSVADICEFCRPAQGRKGSRHQLKRVYQTPHHLLKLLVGIVKPVLHCDCVIVCVVSAPSLSKEEREQKEQMIRAWREHKTALHSQGQSHQLNQSLISSVCVCVLYTESAVKKRLQLTKTKAVEVVAYLKVYTIHTYHHTHIYTHLHAHSR